MKQDKPIWYEGLLDAGAAVTKKSEWEETPLFSAVRQGSSEIVEMLIEADLTIADMPNRSGMTPLAAAARAGKGENVVLLLEYDVDIESTDNWGWQPLHHAVWMDHAETVRFLLEAGADRNAQTTNGETVLELAEIGGSINAMNLLRN